MYNCSVITNVNLFFKWPKLNLKPYPHSRKNHKYPVQAFILKLKHLALKLVNYIKKPIEGKEDNHVASKHYNQ
jgi:hypothetical protein